jgi:hypothetical protein
MPRVQMAYELRVQGKSHQEIADVLGYQDGVEVQQLLNERYQLGAAQLSDSEKRGMLDLEMARLDKLQSVLWAQAEYGDPKVIDSIVKIIWTRAKLARLDDLDTKLDQHTILVIGGNQKAYVEKLKELANE